jgi:hypothetical protein
MSKLRNENTLIDRFFERRQNDPRGGDDGKRIVQVTSRPVFGLTSGRMRAATWFDTSRPPQGIVWLLDAQMHDERHKGSSDAYDRFAALEAAGQLFPEEVDYKWVEFDRRRLDTQSFTADVRRDAEILVGAARTDGRATGTLAGVDTRLAWDASGSLPELTVGISTKPAVGLRSGLAFPLSNQRFFLLAEAVRAAGEALFGPQVLVDEIHAPPASLGKRENERYFVVVFEHG